MKHFLGAAFAVVLTAALMAPNTARSAVIINFEETITGVTMTLSGTLDLTGATPFGQANSVSGINPGLAIVSIGGSLSDTYLGLSGPSSFGTGGMFSPSSVTGSPFFMLLANDRFRVPAGYPITGGPTLDATLTFDGENFASMGLTLGQQFVWTIPSGDTITLNIIAASVPAPAGLPLALAGLGAVALIRRRRKRYAC